MEVGFVWTTAVVCSTRERVSERKHTLRCLSIRTHIFYFSFFLVSLLVVFLCLHHHNIMNLVDAAEPYILMAFHVCRVVCVLCVCNARRVSLCGVIVSGAQMKTT